MYLCAHLPQDVRIDWRIYGDLPLCMSVFIFHCLCTLHSVSPSVSLPLLSLPSLRHRLLLQVVSFPRPVSLALVSHQISVFYIPMSRCLSMFLQVVDDSTGLALFVNVVRRSCTCHIVSLVLAPTHLCSPLRFSHRETLKH